MNRELGWPMDPQSWIAWNDAIDEESTTRQLSARERELRTTARAVSAEVLMPRARAVDIGVENLDAGLSALCQAGLGGLTFAEEYGGSADTHVAYVTVMEEIAAACGSTSLLFMTQTHTANPIVASQEEALAHRYLPGLIDGSLLGSMAVTEPDAGSDVASMSTTARFEGDAQTGQYILNGSKTFITTGDRADVIVVFATVNRASGRDGITAFVVDGDSEGLVRGRPMQKMGMHGSGTAELFFSDVRVPAAQRLGPQGSGWSLVMGSVTKSRVSAAAQGVGLARGAYLRTARALQRTDGTYPDAVANVLADVRSDLVQSRLLLQAVARGLDEGSSDTGQIAIMKRACTDLGWSASVRLAGLLGPAGDDPKLEVERCVRDSKVTQIYDGTNEVQRALIARDTARRTRSLT